MAWRRSSGMDEMPATWCEKERNPTEPLILPSSLCSSLIAASPHSPRPCAPQCKLSPIGARIVMSTLPVYMVQIKLFTQSKADPSTLLHVSECLE